jgi:hypothetical protein
MPFNKTKLTNSSKLIYSKISSNYPLYLLKINILFLIKFFNFLCFKLVEIILKLDKFKN